MAEILTAHWVFYSGQQRNHKNKVQEKSKLVGFSPCVLVKPYSMVEISVINFVALSYPFPSTGRCHKRYSGKVMCQTIYNLKTVSWSF